MKRPEDATHAPTERPSQRQPVRRCAASGFALALMLSRWLARGRTARFDLGLLAASALLLACNLDNPGVTAPPGTLSYPIAVALSRGQPSDAGAEYLYVANSNFDLTYSTGSVQSYDLNELERMLGEQGCRDLERTVMLDGGVLTVTDDTPRVGDAGRPLDGGVEERDGSIAPPDYEATSRYGNPRGVLCDGRDDISSGDGGLGWQVPDASVDAGVTGLRPPVRCCFDEGNKLGHIRRADTAIDSFASGVGVAPDGQRVYVPISSRAALLYLDTRPDGGLDCGGETGRCRRGPNPDSENAPNTDPDLKFPGQPASVLVGTLDQLGLPETATFIATAHELGGFGLFVERPEGGPVLQAAINGLPLRPTSLVLSPTEQVLYVANAGDISYLSRIGVRESANGRPLLYLTSQVTLTGFALPRDMRDVAFDPRRLNPGDPNDLRLRHPERLYALVRGLQESVAFLERDSTTASSARLLASVRVGAGPSKLQFIEMDGRAFLLVSCYDGRSVFVIDADLREVVAVVRNLAGPFTMAFDPVRKLLFVADFRASVVRVVDLQGVTNKREPPPRIIATLGLPRFQGGLK